MARKVAQTAAQSTVIDHRIQSLILQGLTPREITDRLRSDGLVLSVRAVQLRLQRLAARVRADRATKIEQEEQLLTWIIEQAMQVWQAQPGGRSWAALNVMIKASESRRRLLGLDAPARNKHLVMDGDPITIIEVTPHEHLATSRLQADGDRTPGSDAGMAE